jgi:hypothetical protein
MEEYRERSETATTKKSSSNIDNFEFSALVGVERLRQERLANCWYRGESNCSAA